MSENKRKKKKKRRRNNSSKKKKIDVIFQREDERKSQPVVENSDGSKQSRRGMFADCYQMVYSRIANAFVPRDHHGLHKETTLNVGCKSEPTIPQNGTPFLQSTESLSKEDNFGYQSKTENHSRDDLFEAMLELCKPRPRTNYLVDKPMRSFVNLYHDIDNFTLSLLIELFNNEPCLSTYKPMENTQFGSDILDTILKRGNFDSMYEQTQESKPNRRYADQIKNPAKLDRKELQEMLGKILLRVFFFCPCYVCSCLTTSQLVERPTNTAEKDTEIFYGPECETKGLPLPLGVRENRVDKKTIDPLAGRIYPQDVGLHVNVAQGNREKGVKIMQLLTGITDTSREMFRNIETDISAKRRRRLKFHAAHLMDVSAVSTSCTIENTNIETHLHQNFHLNRNLQVLTQKKQNFSDVFRLSFNVGQESNTIIMKFTSTELWRLIQPFQNYLKIRQTTTQRLQDQNRVDVVQYRSSEQMIGVTVDVPGRNRLYISSVPLALLKMLMYIFKQRFRAVDVQNTFASIYQVPAFFRYGPASNRLYLKNQNQRTSNENVTFAILQRNSFIFWQHFPRPRDVYEIAMSNTTGENIDTIATRLDGPKMTNDQQKPDQEPVATGLEGAEGYESFHISEPYIDQKNNEWDHPKGTRNRDYQTFDGNVPDSLTDIQVPTIDITDIQFKTDMDGNWILFVSGGFGDIFQARLSTTEDEVIVKKVKNMTYNDVLRETEIQTYLMKDGFVPKMLGIIGGPGHPETMIVQQMCSKGRTLYDFIEDCLAEALVLFTSHWLEVCYKLAVNLERMHDKSVLHNDIKADNILVDIRPNDVRVYYIDFGQASFRSGSTLLLPDECDSSEDLDDYIAPEVRSGFHSSPKSDIYSLGVIFGDIADEFCECLGPLADEMCYENPRKRLTLEEVSEQIEELIMENECN